MRCSPINQSATINDALASGARGKKFRERRDIASGEVMEESDLIRMAIGPDGQIVPDLAARLPGRGIWIAANRIAIEQARIKGAFARSAKSKVNVPSDLADLTEHLLRQKLLGLLGMAQKAGQIETGYDSVRSMIAGRPPAWRLAAQESARDGRNKIRVASKAAWNATPVLGCFNSGQLGTALGREDVTHGALQEGALAETFTETALKLSGFCALIPDSWEQEREDFALWLSAER